MFERIALAVAVYGFASAFMVVFSRGMIKHSYLRTAGYLVTSPVVAVATPLLMIVCIPFALWKVWENVNAELL